MTFNDDALAVFNIESGSPSDHRCAPVTDSVHGLSAAFFHFFKLNAFVGMTPHHVSVPRAILDIGAGPNLVRESFLPQKWKKYWKPLGFKFNIMDANGDRMLPLGNISSAVTLRNSRLRISFYAVEIYPFRLSWDAFSSERYIKWMIRSR